MVEKILIYRIGNLGDIICTIPAMVAVRRHFPDAWIGLLTNKESTGNPDAEEIIKNNEFLNDIITYKPEKIREPGYLLALLKRLHSLKIDLLVYFSISQVTHKRLIRDWFFFNLVGCKKLTGFKLPKPIKTCEENGLKIPIFPNEVDRLLGLLVPLGVDQTKVEFFLPIKQRDRDTVDQIWNHYKLNNKSPIIVISPGGKFTVNHWDVKKYVEIASILQREFNAQIILIGGIREKGYGEEIVSEAGNSIVNLIGKTNYMESAEVLSRCDLLISNDCGPAHLAAAVGTIVVGIFSSRNYYGSWHPWGEKNIILRNDKLSCRFCHRTECETMRCIKSITAKQVIDACTKVLGNKCSTRRIKG
jgi:heptosyltransferase III